MGLMLYLLNGKLRVEVGIKVGGHEAGSAGPSHPGIHEMNIKADGGPLPDNILGSPFEDLLGVKNVVGQASVRHHDPLGSTCCPRGKDHEGHGVRVCRHRWRSCGVLLNLLCPCGRVQWADLQPLQPDVTGKLPIQEIGVNTWQCIVLQASEYAWQHDFPQPSEALHQRMHVLRSRAKDLVTSGLTLRHPK